RGPELGLGQLQVAPVLQGLQGRLGRVQLDPGLPDQQPLLLDLLPGHRRGAALLQAPEAVEILFGILVLGPEQLDPGLLQLDLARQLLRGVIQAEAGLFELGLALQAYGLLAGPRLFEPGPGDRERRLAFFLSLQLDQDLPLLDLSPLVDALAELLDAAA